MALVSVIVPYFNQERYLAQAIESVQSQSLADWELLLINDGSSDSGPHIAARYAASDRRIRLLQHADGRNKGVSASRNLGMRNAMSSLLTFLDGDDIFLPEKLITERSILERTPHVASVYGRSIWRYDDGRPDQCEDLGVTANQIYLPPELVTRIILRHEGAVPCTCAVMVRRDAALAAGEFPETFSLYEDQVFWVKLFSRFAVFVSNHVAAVYRQHPHSTSALAAKRGLYDPIGPHSAERAFLEWVQEFAERGNVRSDDFDQALRQRLATYRYYFLRQLRRSILAPAKRKLQSAFCANRGLTRATRSQSDG